MLFVAGLGEYRIRDLNDEINKLLREKYHWEVQIFNLGGPNYRRIGPRYLDREGREVPGNRGYRYFGAARELPGKKKGKTNIYPYPHISTRVPCSKNYLYHKLSLSCAGVRELFEQEPMPVPKKSRAELMKDIDADYYGYRDDDDGILIPLEQDAEKEGIFFTHCPFPSLSKLLRFALQLLRKQLLNGKQKKRQACWSLIKITQKKTFTQRVA